jgi:hypothetical protein
MPAFAQHEPITFSVIGDVPYDLDEIEDLEQHIRDHNRMSPSEFLVHLGDILESDEECTEPSYQLVADALQGLVVPAFVILGDNEWTDCPDPDRAFALWEAYFLGFESGFCGAPRVEAQAVRPENFAFTSKGVLFVGINLVGGEPYDEDEWETRLQQDVDWVGQQLAQKRPLVRAAVVFGHAGPGESAHDPFFDAFGPLAGAFGKPVLYAMGDGHDWIVDKPFPQQNVTRLQVERGTDPPVQVTVGLDPLAPFTIVRDPWPSGTPPFNREPCVDVGPDLFLGLGQGASLSARVVDDGVPESPGVLTTSWSQTEGPAQASIADASSVETSASFPSPGRYVLQLTAHDGGRLGVDGLAVDVAASAPVLTLDEFFVDEGDVATFTVRLLSGDGSPVAVDYASSDGSAQAPGDYAPVSGTLAFSGAIAQATVTTPVHADGLVEALETFQLKLSSPAGAILGKAKGVARVLDGDSPTPPFVESFSPTSGPSGTQVVVTGAGLADAREVEVGGVPAASFVVDGDRQLRAVVSAAADTGPVVVTTPVGVDSSAGSFAATLPRLNVTVSGSGSVAFDPPGGTYSLGTVVTVTAVPGPGFDFASFGGDLAGLSSPAAVTMDRDHSGSAHFDPLPPGTTSLDVLGQGPGSLSWSPGGRLHPLGASVTLTATPDPSALFVGWSGDLSGQANPETLEMSSSRSVTGTFTRAGLTVLQEDYEKGSSSGSASVTTDDPIPAVAGDLYLAAVTARPRVDALGVGGLGLVWNELVTQCTGRNESEVSLWWALGVPSGEGSVTATLADVATNATIVVTRYSGVDAAAPLGSTPNVLAGNVHGQGGACSGGIRTSSYALPHATVEWGSVVHAAVASTTRHNPGDDWTEITERRTGSGSELAGLAVMERSVRGPGALSVEGRLSDDADWAVVAVEIRRQELLPPAVFSFSPWGGPAGTEVTILGTGLGGASEVAFGGVPAPSPVVDTRAQMRAVVPEGAHSGPIRVTTPLGSGASFWSFFVGSAPSVTSFTPLAGAVGTRLTVRGSGFAAGATEVRFGGRALGKSLTVLDPRTLVVSVPRKAVDGPLVVENPTGAGQSATSFDVVPACSDGLDNDLDGSGDFPDDLGCSGPLDASERSDRFVCDDGIDNDLDGLADAPLDPGCQLPISQREDPPCDDGVDNDGDGAVDWDGGPLGGVPDPSCNGHGWKNEDGSACGLGFELAVLLPLLGRLGARKLLRPRSGRAWKPQSARA